MQEILPSPERHKEMSLNEAIQLATEFHEGQPDKGDGGPYIRHPMRVMRALEPYGIKAQRVGVLHDIVEDTDMTLDDLRSRGLPEDEIEAVDSVTKRPDETKLDAIDRARQNPIGKIVKLADNRDNGNRKRHSPLLSEEQRNSYHDNYDSKMDRLIQDDPWLAAQAPLVQARIEAIYEADRIQKSA